MQKALAIFSGVLAAAAILAAPAHPEPGRHERGGGEARAGYGGGGGGGPQGRGEGGFRYAPPGVYAGERRDYRYAAPPPAYQQGYAAPQRRPNSLGSEWREQQEEARSGVRQGQMAPLGSVISGIGHHSRGRPLDAGIEYQGARAVYRVRWLMNNGRRVDYIVDAATGRILSEH